MKHELKIVMINFKEYCASKTTIFLQFLFYGQPKVFSHEVYHDFGYIMTHLRHSGDCIKEPNAFKYSLAFH